MKILDSVESNTTTARRGGEDLHALDWTEEAEFSWGHFRRFK